MSRCPTCRYDLPPWPIRRGIGGTLAIGWFRVTDTLPDAGQGTPVGGAVRQIARRRGELRGNGTRLTMALAWWLTPAWWMAAMEARNDGLSEARAWRAAATTLRGAARRVTPGGLALQWEPVRRLCGLVGDDWDAVAAAASVGGHAMFWAGDWVPDWVAREARDLGPVLPGTEGL